MEVSSGESGPYLQHKSGRLEAKKNWPREKYKEFGGKTYGIFFPSLPPLFLPSSSIYGLPAICAMPWYRMTSPFLGVALAQPRDGGWGWRVEEVISKPCWVGLRIVGGENMQPPAQATTHQDLGSRGGEPVNIYNLLGKGKGRDRAWRRAAEEGMEATQKGEELEGRGAGVHGKRTPQAEVPMGGGRGLGLLRTRGLGSQTAFKSLHLPLVVVGWRGGSLLTKEIKSCPQVAPF